MPFDIASFKNTIDREITTFLDTEIARYKTISSHEIIADLLTHQHVVSAGGKRIRPLLVYSLYQHTYKEADTKAIMPLLLAVELFHVFCLIHDDIMDESALRHDAPTTHEYAKRFYPHHPRATESQAILVGDILFNSVFRLLHEFTANHPKGAAITSLFHDLIDEVCVGQMLDVNLAAQAEASLDEITEKNRLKTAWYSIVRPLQLGALVAGREDLTSFVTEFGEQIGLLYQTQDDLLDVIGDSKDIHKPRFQDITQKQHTVLRSFIETSGTTEHKALLQSYLGKQITTEDNAALEALFTDSGAVAYAESCIATYQDTAERLIREYITRPVDLSLFTTLMSIITKRTH